MNDITLETTNKLAKEFYKRYNSKSNMFKHREKFIKLIKGNRILDVGCGTGRDSREFNNKGFSIYGIDVSNEMLKIAKKEAPNANLYLTSMEGLKFDRKYNGIWVCSSLYHIRKDKVLEVIKSFYNALKKEGLLFITVKEGKGQGHDSRKYFGKLKKFYAYYDEYELSRLLFDAKFKIIDMYKEHKDQVWINVYARKKEVSK